MVDEVITERDLLTSLSSGTAGRDSLKISLDD
jgi:hypothetical protein